MPGLSPAFHSDPSASMVLIVAGESALGQETNRAEESAAVAAAPGKGLVQAEAAAVVPGNISSSSVSGSSARRLMMMKMKEQQQQMHQQQRKKLSLSRRRLALSLPPQPVVPADAAASSSSPPRASWSGALSESSPKDKNDARFSVTPLVVDTEGRGYRFQVSVAASGWAPALTLYRGEVPSASSSSSSSKKNGQLVAASSSPLPGKPNSMVLSVGDKLERGEVYSLVVTAAAGTAEKNKDGTENDSASTAVGSFAALASGPGGVYPGATSVPPRWRVESSTVKGGKGDSASASASSAYSTSTTKGVLRRPKVEGEASDSSAVVAFEALPFVLASSGRGFELRVAAGRSASSLKDRSWAPWVAVYELEAFEEALRAASSESSSSSSSELPLSTSGLVATAVAPAPASSKDPSNSVVTLQGLSLEGAGKRYALLVGGRTSADGGDFVAEVFGPEAVKGFVAAATPPPSPSTAPPPPPSSSPPHLVEEAPAPSSSSSSGLLPRLLEPVSVDPPPPSPVKFVQYGIQVRSFFLFFFSDFTF